MLCAGILGSVYSDIFNKTRSRVVFFILDKCACWNFCSAAEYKLQLCCVKNYVMKIISFSPENTMIICLSVRFHNCKI